MHIRLIQRAAVIGASALALAHSAAFAQDWTSFKVGQLTNFSFSHAHQPDGRFVFGTVGQVFIQDTFGSGTTTAMTNTENVLLDPSFVAVRSGSQALVGAGGFAGPSGVYLFDPSSPATSLVTPALATLQNYTGTFWKHPTSGREGWLIVGANGAAGSSNITFVSTDGVTVGSVTGTLSAFSGSIAVDAYGNVFTSLADLDAALNNQIIKFTADQIDAAVQALLALTPAPLARTAAEVIFLADASGSMAVDAAGRVWVGGYQISHLQAYDPATGGNRRFLPDHAPLEGAFGPPNYSPKVFSKDAVDYVSFLANDGWYTNASDLVIGYKPVSELIVRSAQITTASQSVTEAGGTIQVTVTLTPAATEAITVPVTVSGTATEVADFTHDIEDVVFAVGETTKTFEITVVDDAIKGESAETVVVTLGEPSPIAQAGLGALDSETFVLTITDNDPMPIIGFTATAQTVQETHGSVDVTVSVNPTVTETVTVPLTLTGTATNGAEYTAVTELTLQPGDVTKTVTINVTDDDTSLEMDEIVIVTLGAPAPVGQAELGLQATRQFVLTILDDENKARIATEQNFGTLRVGSGLNLPVETIGGTALKWSAKGLPPGLKMNADGTITGTPTTPGEYDQVIITVTNEYGASSSVAFLLNVEPFPAGAVGTFTGLVNRVGDSTDGLGARVSLTTTTKGSYSGKVQVGKKSHAIKGMLDTSDEYPEGSIDIKMSTGTQRFEFVVNSDTGELTGNLPGGAMLAGWRAQTSSARTGIYNFLAAQPGDADDDVPQGSSFGSLKLSTKAIATVTGLTADGSKFTSSSPLSIEGDVIIYQTLYTTPGTFSGRVSLADSLEHEITGSLTWSKPEQLKGVTYKDGWPTPLTLTVGGGKYRPAAGATLPMNLPEASGNNARLLLQDGGIELAGNGDNPKSFELQIVSAKKVVIPAPHKMKLVNTTGAFSGSVTVGEGALRKVVPFQGLLVPDTETDNAFDSEGFGYFILPTQTPGTSRSGAVFLEPLTDDA